MNDVYLFSTHLSDHPSTVASMRRLTSYGSVSSRTHDVAIPDEFDGRVVWNDLLGSIRNQGSCGSCWAFASTTALSQRIAIYTRGDVRIELSPAQSVLCDFGEREVILQNLIHKQGGHKVSTKDLDDESMRELACHGNSILGAMQHLYRFGTTSESCTPYDLGPKYLDLGKYDEAKIVPLCEEIMGGTEFVSCIDGSPARRYRVINYYNVHGTPSLGGSEENIRREIYMRGPVTAGMTVYADFVKRGGSDVYDEVDGVSVEGGHAVVIVGWGTKDTVPYWIVQNSWGNEWGDNGYFLIRRGNNTCGIETNVYGGVPELPNTNTIYVPDVLSDPDDESLRNEWPLDTISLLKRALTDTHPELKKPYYGRKDYSWNGFVAGDVTHIPPRKWKLQYAIAIAIGIIIAVCIYRYVIMK
uniref:Peptidase C1A papain C-terminal domain-containing protein n=1 Tax=viral metagenome TaxID=1070528 RepID=A0A6C0LZ90_9ZZZZ